GGRWASPRHNPNPSLFPRTQKQPDRSDPVPLSPSIQAATSLFAADRLKRLLEALAQSSKIYINVAVQHLRPRFKKGLVNPFLLDIRGNQLDEFFQLVFKEAHDLINQVFAPQIHLAQPVAFLHDPDDEAGQLQVMLGVPGTNNHHLFSKVPFIVFQNDGDFLRLCKELVDLVTHQITLSKE